MRFPTHADWCEHLAELGCLKEDPDHNPCILADRCVAGEGTVFRTDDSE